MAALAISSAIENSQTLIKQVSLLREIPFAEEYESVSLSQTQIIELDVLISSTRETMKALEDNLANIRKARNFAASSINRLPLELLIRVFDLSLGSFHQLRNAYTLSSVCRYWKQIAENTPSFYTTISFNDYPVLIHRAIKLSSPLLVDIDYSTNTWPQLWKYNVSDFYRDLLPIMGRCRSLSIMADNIWDIKSLENCSAPTLEKLSILTSAEEAPTEDGEQEDQVEIVDLFGGDAPKLQDVLLSGTFSIPWQTKMLSGLLECRLTHLGHSGPSIPDIMSILRRSPELEVMHLELDRPHDQTFVDSGETVELPFLKELALPKGLSDAGTRYLLSHIISPQCQFFEIQMSSEVPPRSTISYAIAHVLQVVRPVASTEHGTVKIELRDPGCSFFCQANRMATMSGSHELHLMMSPAMADEELQHILDAITPVMSDFEVHADYSCSSVDMDERWTSLISRLPNLSTLQMGGGVPLLATLRYLSSPQIVHGSKQWPLPGLKNIWLVRGGGEHLSEILVMVQSRYGVNIEAREGMALRESTEDLPAALEMLSIYESQYDHELWLQIGNVIGEKHAKVIRPTSSRLD